MRDKRVFVGLSIGSTAEEVVGNLQGVMISAYSMPLAVNLDPTKYQDQCIFVIGSRFNGAEDKAAELVEDLLRRKHLVVVVQEGTTINASRFKGAEIVYRTNSGLTFDILPVIDRLEKQAA